ncbi:MAG: hypothetical protein WCO84_01985 [bacterium]
MSDLEFIKDDGLRKILEDSMEFIFVLYTKQAKENEQNKLYQEEVYRVIILYVISIIEAVLLYFFKERGEKIEYFEYKYPSQLLPGYRHKEKLDFPVVIAVQEIAEKKEHQIGLKELIVFFRDKKLIQEKLAEEILEINDVRNTFHFSKPRDKSCDLKRVENAVGLLLNILEQIPNSLQKK